jgi:hypothetical protein
VTVQRSVPTNEELSSDAQAAIAPLSNLEKAIRRLTAIRYGVRIARICSIPVLVLAFTGWIPDQYLDVGPKGPWPWGALIGFSLIAVALVGLVRPVVETLRGDIEKSRVSSAKGKLR